MFKLIGTPIVVPVTVGFNNLNEQQLESLEEQCWYEDDFPSPADEPFFDFKEAVWSTEMDLHPVDKFSILFNSGFEYQFSTFDKMYALTFERKGYGIPVSVTIQQIELTNPTL